MSTKVNEAETKMELSQSTMNDMKRLKMYFPYRVVYGAVNPATGEQVSGARKTKAAAKNLAKKGWSVWTI
jgi:hypothetical protein